MITTYKFGLLSEQLAVLFLRLKAYKILCRRYKHHTGEIDIIAKKKDTLVFIEVKSRKKIDTNYELVSKKQINRIKRTALLYMASNKRYNSNVDIRFDLIIISNLIFIDHIKNAW
jgi:putative endonuclease